MNRTDFLADPDVSGFLDFFSSCLDNLEVDYRTGYRRIHPTHRRFHVTGVVAAHASYAWPSHDTFIGPPNPPIYDWLTTARFLTAARTALGIAISTHNDAATWDAVNKILVWGLGNRGAPAVLAQLHAICPGAGGMTISTFLEDVRHALTLGLVDTAHINDELIPYASSGTSKIHSLASTDGLVIFDSRVAAMLGECINEYLRRQHATHIPASLKIFVQHHHVGVNPTQRLPKPLANGTNHSNFQYNSSWIECQVRVSWLFEEALRRKQEIFPGLPMPDRMHKLEAACFMMGAYLQPGPFAGRSYSFAHC